ncbi:MAG: hypothetical protein ACRDYY_12395 [Acidimicrobiales bacterium]
MGHVSDGMLRRLSDEPFAVSDTAFEHVARCDRCQVRREGVATSARAAAEVLSGPQLVPDVDRAWADLQARLRRLDRPRRTWRPGRAARPAWILGVSARTAVIGGVVSATLVGAASAAALTSVFAPTHVAPLKLNAGDLSELSQLLTVGNTGNAGGFPTPQGEGSLPFGKLRWVSSGPAHQVQTLSEAEALSGMTVSLPDRLPAGVGSPVDFVVQPRITATVSFDQAAGKLAGASATIEAGPVVSVAYGSNAGSLDMPTLAVITMPRPTGTATGATISQIESYLLSRPGIPPELAQEIRLLGDPSTVLPVPTLAGMSSKQVQVAGHTGVVIGASGGVASAVIWEDGAGVVHAVGGLVDQQSVLSVANQLP